LLVDDDDGLRALLRTTFEAVDVEVDEASNATTARERIEVARPDAIVLDVSMPGLDGAAFCAQLKASRATRDIPVVLLTGSDMADEATAAEVGAEAFMLKPFSPLELLAVVERLAGGRHGTPYRTAPKQPDEQPYAPLIESPLPFGKPIRLCSKFCAHKVRSSPRKKSITATHIAGVVTIQPFFAQPSSGSSAWSATTFGKMHWLPSSRCNGCPHGANSA